MATDDARFDLTVKINCNAVPVGVFAHFLLGLRTMLVQSLIMHFLSQERHVERPDEDSLSKLAKSYLAKMYRTHPYELHFERYWRRASHSVFVEYPLEESLFESWIDEIFAANDITIERVSGGSIELTLAIAVVLQTAGINYNYSMLKDVTALTIQRFKDAILKRSSIPPGNIESVPRSVIKLASDPSVRSLDFTSDGHTVSLKVRR